MQGGIESVSYWFWPSHCYVPSRFPAAGSCPATFSIYGKRGVRQPPSPAAPQELGGDDHSRSMREGAAGPAEPAALSGAAAAGGEVSSMVMTSGGPGRVSCSPASSGNVQLMM